MPIPEWSEEQDEAESHARLIGWMLFLWMIFLCVMSLVPVLLQTLMAN